MDTNRIDLEAKVAFLERTIDALSESMHEQAKTIDALQRRIERIEQRQGLGSDPGVGPHDDPPPHY